MALKIVIEYRHAGIKGAFWNWNLATRHYLYLRLYFIHSQKGIFIYRNENETHRYVICPYPFNALTLFKTPNS